MLVQRMRPRLIRGGFGDAAVAVPGFSDGLMAWKSPGTAFNQITTTISGGNLTAQAPYLGGLLAVPVAGLLLASRLMGGRRRR